MAEADSTAVHPETDMLMLYSTSPGKASLRSPDEGTWYIQELCGVMEEEARHTHFEEIARKTGLRVKGKVAPEDATWVQQPERTNRGFDKELYLNPGWFAPPPDLQEEPLPSQQDVRIEQAIPLLP